MCMSVCTREGGRETEGKEVCVHTQVCETMQERICEYV